MNSETLRASGFATWMPFNGGASAALVRRAPTRPGVYVIRCRTPFPRATGTSDVLYVGSAGNRYGIRMRLRQYFHPGPTQRTSQRILARCGDSADYEISYVECESAQAAARLEATLLAQCVSEHGELPPENRMLPTGTKAVANTSWSAVMPTNLPNAGASSRADVVWKRIESNAGTNFKTVTGLLFSYSVIHNAVRPSVTNRLIPRSDFEKALRDVPLKNTTVIRHLQGPSYIFAILMDERIRAGDW